MATKITDSALASLAKEVVANDTLRYGRDADEYPHTKGSAYILAEAFGITPREARTKDANGDTPCSRFMAAWRAAGGLMVTGTKAPAKAPAKPKRARKAPAKATQTVEIAAPTDKEELALTIARAILAVL